MRKREEQSALALIERLLKDKGGLTSYQLAELLGINIRNVRPYMKILHDRKTVFIQDWKTPKHGHGPKIPVWRLDEYDDGDDEPYPKPICPQQRARIYRKRKNANVAIKASFGTGATLRR